MEKDKERYGYKGSMGLSTCQFLLSMSSLLFFGLRFLTHLLSFSLLSSSVFFLTNSHELHAPETLNLQNSKFVLFVSNNMGYNRMWSESGNYGLECELDFIMPQRIIELGLGAFFHLKSRDFYSNNEERFTS